MIMGSLFNCQFQEVLSAIYLGDSPFALAYGGAAVIDYDNFLVASKTNPEIYWVYRNNIVNSCKLQYLTIDSAELLEEWQCCGLVLAANCTDGFILVMNRQGLLKILRFQIDMETKTIRQSAALSPLNLSQRVVPYKGVSLPGEWNGDVDYSIFQLTHYDENTEFLQYHPLAELGPALVNYPPCMCLCGNKLVLGINHWQFIAFQQKHLLAGVTLERFKVWAAQIESTQYTKDIWWFDSWAGILEAYTPMRHPVFLSSLVVVDPMSFRVEGISHIGSSVFTNALRETSKYYIQALLSQENVVEAILKPILHTVPRDRLCWGNPTFVNYKEETGEAEHLFNAFLLWWDQHHMKQDLLTVFPNPGLTTGVKSARTAVEDLIHFNRKPVYLSLKPLDLPFNTATPMKMLATSSLVNTALGVFETSLIKYNTIYHELESWSASTLLGIGLDVYIGEIVKDSEKIILVKFKNIHNIYTLHSITLRIEPDELNAAYINCRLSADSHVWFDASSSLTLAGQVPPAGVTDFYVKVTALQYARQPVPIRFKISYNFTW